NFNTGVVYEFPKWRAAGRLGEGWQIGSVAAVVGGRPWTPLISTSGDESGQDLVYQRADFSGVKPVYQFSDPNSPTITNAAAIFSDPAPNTIGSCGRNSLRGPKFRQWDINLNKTTKITERMRIQVRLEIFNLLNHPNFSSLTASAKPSSRAFSTYSQTPDIGAGNAFLSQGGPRAAQIGAKLIF